jgi:hypothetical protein
MQLRAIVAGTKLKDWRGSEPSNVAVDISQPRNFDEPLSLYVSCCADYVTAGSLAEIAG